MPRKRVNESCKGRAAGCTPEAGFKGHQVKEFRWKSSPLFVCLKCGGMSSRNDTGKLLTTCKEPTRWGKQVLRGVLIQRQHPQHRGQEGRLDNFDFEMTDPAVMTKRDVSVRQLSNKSSRGSSQWVPKVPSAAEADPALMTFSEEEPDD